MPRRPHSNTLDPSQATEETRQLILQAAQRLFFEGGYRAVTTRQVAQACGLTQPALYHHFADKQDLYTAVIIQELQHIKSNLERTINHSSVLEERLVLVSEYLLTSMRMEMSMMFHDISHELRPEQQATLGRAYQDCLFQPILTMFESAMTEGKLPAPAAGGIAPGLAAQLYLSSISNFLGHDREEYLKFVGHNQADIARLIVRLQLYGMSQPTTKS